MQTHRTSFQRHSIRLPEYDYTSQGCYFITISANIGIHLFGEVIDGEMELNAAGRMVEQVWHDLPIRFENIRADICKAMPNHFHAILVINQKNCDHVGAYVGTFKSLTTMEYIKGVRQNGWKPFEGKLWLMNYYEHVIRSDDEYGRIYEYIQNNALKWDMLHKEKMPWDE